MGDAPLSEETFAERLFGQLDTLERRYRRFMHRASFAIGLLILANLWFLFVALPHKTDEIQSSRAGAIRQFCQDEKVLLSLVPEGYGPQVDDPASVLNPRRDCAAFARQALRTP